MPEQQETDGPPTLAAKLDHLFATVRPAPGTREHSLEDVSRAIAASGGPTISATYIWQLRRGARTNPRMSHLEALAKFFGVDPGYFFPGELAARMEADLEAVGPVLRDPGAQALAWHAAGLPKGTQAVLVEVAQLARRAHGLPGVVPA